jgi:regulator of cell morphogenesis and NO signaling
MQITARTTVAEIAAAEPSTIKLFQRHKIDFCCGGKIPLADACARQGLDTDALLAELRAVRAAADDPAGWGRAPLKDLIGHIQARLPAALLPLQATFESLHRELVEHMSKEDTVLFPAVLALEANAAAEGTLKDWTWIAQPIDVMEAEHDAAGAALARMRALTGGYAPPEDACPTFRGLYFGLAELERDMHLHVHLENHVLFPRAEQLAVARSVDKEPRRVNESRVGA